MAIYHLSGTIISRGQGRSAVACAAYRSGSCLQDERYQKNHDYSLKGDVIHKEILLPKDAPAWMLNREKLWNAVEAHEKRKDAQLAREFNFALPKELSFEQNLALARTFVQEQFVNEGMVADLALHGDKNEEGVMLYHAHVMLTLRSVSQDGFGPKVRTWNAKEKLLSWREAWANTANLHLAQAGLDMRIDHRTLEAQAIDLEPQSKIGPTVARHNLARLQDHERIARENGERLLAQPSIALYAITQQQATFTEQDLARFVTRHTVDETQFKTVLEALRKAEGLVALGLDSQGRERFSTKEMLALERTMLKEAHSLSQSSVHTVKDQASQAALKVVSLSQEQHDAFHYLLEPSSIRCLIGYAGSGKSYLLGAAREAWEGSGFRVQGVALSGIAAQSLEGGSGIASRTLASRCYYWDQHEQKLGPRDILVVDEAGMLGTRQMARIMSEAFQGGSKVVLVGDPQQLQAIEAGAAFRALTERYSFVELSEIRRQRTPWQQEATRCLARGQTREALAAYEHHLHVHPFLTQAEARASLISLWNDVRLSSPHESQLILAYTKADVLALNTEARTLRHAQGELGADYSFMTHQGERFFAKGDRLYFLKNDRDLGVMNGSLGTIVDVHKKVLSVSLDPIGSRKGPKIIPVHTDLYQHLDHGYAATIHKSQGVTVDRTYLLAERYLDAHATYVGLSRHRESVELFWSKEVFPSLEGFIRTLGRDKSKDLASDYGVSSFAHERGIEPHAEPSIIREVPHLSQSKPMLQTPRQTFDILQGLKSNNPLLKSRSALADFKAKFEEQQPERAQQIQRSILPLSERIGRDFEIHINHLQQKLSRNPSERVQDELKSAMHEAHKNQKIMDYLHDKNSTLADHVKKSVKDQSIRMNKTIVLQKEKELDR